MKYNRTKHRDYSDKIMYWQNQLNESINCAPVDLNSAKIEKALESLTYFVNKQIEIVKENEDDSFQDHYNAVIKHF